MKARLIRIGNSKGIRIPRAVLEECGLRDPVDLEVRRGALIVRPGAKPRAGWEDAFRRMAREGDDALLDPDAVRETGWERNEWRW